MLIKVYEGIRHELTAATSVVINFRESHETMPIVNAMVELHPSIGPASVIASIDGITTSNATISFSTAFTGYLHLHVFSS